MLLFCYQTNYNIYVYILYSIFIQFYRIIDYYPPIELVEEKPRRLQSEVTEKMLHASSGEEYNQAWEESRKIGRKMEYHRIYGEKRYLSPWQAGSLSTEEYEEMLSEIDTDSIPEMDYQSYAQQKYSKRQTLIGRFKSFLTKLWK